MTLFPGVAFITGAASGMSILTASSHHTAPERWPRYAAHLQGNPHVQDSANMAKGIGRQTAISFAVEGCKKLALVDLDDTGLGETARLCREASADVETITLPTDVSDEASVAKAVSGAVEKWGRIDYAVNCAGMFGNSPCLSFISNWAPPYQSGEQPC